MLGRHYNPPGDSHDISVLDGRRTLVVLVVMLFHRLHNTRLEGSSACSAGLLGLTHRIQLQRNKCWTLSFLENSGAGSWYALQLWPLAVQKHLHLLRLALSLKFAAALLAAYLSFRLVKRPMVRQGRRIAEHWLLLRNPAHVSP